MSPRYLITGGAGFIGSHLVEALKDQDVTVLDNFSTGKKTNLDGFTGRIIEADVVDVKLDDKYDVIFHLAALARIQPSIKEPIKAHKSNVLGTLNMLQHAKEMGAKLIYSSSSSVYGGKNEPPFREDMPVNPNSPYALQKYTGEEYTRLFHELYGVETVALRYFNVYGERQLTEGAYATVIGIFLLQKSKGLCFTINGTGEQRRDFTYVKDVVRANLDAVNVPSGVYNVGTGINYSVNELAKLIGADRPTFTLPAPQGEYPVTLADMTRFEKTFGWKPESRLESWIKSLKK